MTVLPPIAQLGQRIISAVSVSSNINYGPLRSYLLGEAWIS